MVFQPDEPERPRRWRQAVVCWGLFLVVVGVAWWWAGGGAAAQEDGSAVGTARGQFLWQRDCASCHGADGRGTRLAPDLDAAGAAGVSLAITSGRMPLPAAAVGPGRPPPRQRQVPRGEVAYTPTEIEALVDHAARLLGGPDVPEVDLAAADLANGAMLFQANCAACHSWSGRGGALTSGQVAIPVTPATPVEVVAAMRSGPGTMPVFDGASLDDRAATDVAAYVDELDHPVTPLGDPLWFLGPVAEGFVAWAVGIVALLVLVRWIGARVATATDGTPDGATDAEDS